MDPITKIKRDVKVLKNVSTGSDAFTFLCLKNNNTIYRKIATRKSGDIDKLILQLNWLLKHPQFPIPKISNYFHNHEICWYDMDTNVGCVDMFNYIENHSLADGWEILQSVLKSFKDLHAINLRSADQNLIRSYIISKVKGNIEKILTDGGKYIQTLQGFPDLVINGKTYKNFSYYLGDNGFLSEDKLQEIFANDPCSEIHGDLTLENIIYDNKSEKGFYFIDPNPDNLHGTYLLDYAKLLQSLHGKYENLQRIHYIDIDSNHIRFELNESRIHEQMYSLYDEYLKNCFSTEEYKSIHYHEIVHWLRLLPYKIKKDSRLAVIYYCETLILLDELEKKFGSSK